MAVNSDNPQLCIKSTIVDMYPQLLIVDFEKSIIDDFHL